MTVLHPAQIRPRPPHPLVSLVVPVFNEQEAVPVFLARVAAQVSLADARLEILFVNDGSTDDTLGVLLGITALRPDGAPGESLAQFRQGSRDERRP